MNRIVQQPHFACWCAAVSPALTGTFKEDPMSGTKMTKSRAMRRELLGDADVGKRDIHVADAEKCLNP